MDTGLSPEKVASFTKRLRSEPRYLLAQNVSTCIDPLEVCLHRQTVQDTVHIFQHSIPTEGKPITNQKSSGRCWIFSCLNVMRLPFMKKFNVEEFEFSQSYLFFWDKPKKSEFSCLCSNIPSQVTVFWVLEQFVTGAPVCTALQVFRVASVCLGSPPDTICWEYRDKDKNFHRLGPLSPQEFYRQHVKPLYNIQDKVCLVNDPRPQNPYGKLYSVEFLGNMVGGRSTLYNNQPIQLLKKAAADSIKDGEAVWFGCDVGKHFHSKLGINDMNVFNHELVFGVSVKNLSKAERLIYGDSLMTHAMILTAVTDKDEKGFEKWRVENSWGDDRGNKGYLIMTDDWFSEYVYEVVVDKKFLSDDVMQVMQQEPVVLPAWDPMGALA
ncbi:PREDICTED: bleomycin hydrolase [Cyprinodon variegatus]|uniref:bleomycin hydrolase n=1 Tax=Cyprinodon variegatus TaxID=28743 RepID=UPI000742BD00|nr:PREDICTED: bleomycin hydrolase [Cyprinodon variegatus]